MVNYPDGDAVSSIHARGLVQVLKMARRISNGSVGSSEWFGLG